MIPVVEHSSLLTILYWLLMIPIAIVVLVRVTAFWADDGPGMPLRHRGRRQPA